MGMARAVGMRRARLVEMFLAEGIAYNSGAALIGTITGILVAFDMEEVLESSLDDTFGFNFTQTVSPHSLVVAAGLGVLITLVTVVVSSFRVSHLNRRRHPRPARQQSASATFHQQRRPGLRSSCSP